MSEEIIIVKDAPKYDFNFIATNFGLISIDDIAFKPEAVCSIEDKVLDEEDKTEKTVISLTNGEEIVLAPDQMAYLEKFIKDAKTVAEQMALKQKAAQASAAYNVGVEAGLIDPSTGLPLAPDMGMRRKHRQ